MSERDPIEYLLNAMELAAQHENRASQDYYGKRQAVLKAIRDLRAEVESLRNDVIEECAKVCEAEEVDGTVSREDRAYNMALEHAATAIRALKEREAGA